MAEFLGKFEYLPLLLCVGFFMLGRMIKARLRTDLVNPLLVAIVGCILFLVVTGMDYERFAAGSKPLSYLLTPATICLAIPMVRQWRYLKRYAPAILCAVAAGVLTSLTCVFLLSKLFSLDGEMFATLLPKSITTAMGIGLSQELGGIVTITVAAIVITGIAGNLLAVGMCRMFRVTDPVAKGLAIGTASHALGTVKALEMGEVEGAISSLAIVLSGLMTVVAASVFAQMY